ncbi:hypothetical protein LR48_Vigan05g127900 [Vigna angularis]|uniref:Uncharacterized protein n=1 Tax=Phaseolus angularis TaxID=3914 RepID=A0A0L9UMA4_PHAAN|nr:hypothetical protein LR48_Vigan05g127900 [Vigna angularis]
MKADNGGIGCSEGALRVMQAVTTLNGLMKDIMKLKEAYKGRVKKLKSVWKGCIGSKEEEG